MEPFGLFQFLQSLLQNPSSSTENTAQKQEDEVIPNPPESPREGQQPPVSDTYLQFIANHEKRSHGIRKK